MGALPVCPGGIEHDLSVEAFAAQVLQPQLKAFGLGGGRECDYTDGGTRDKRGLCRLQAPGQNEMPLNLIRDPGYTITPVLLGS